jgi:hypothetical protein
MKKHSLASRFFYGKVIEEKKMAPNRAVLHDVYLPFTEDQLKKHFAPVKKQGNCVGTAEEHMKYYGKSLKNYGEYGARDRSRKGKSLKEMRGPCQIEKDERFWTASCLMTIFRSPERTTEITRLLKLAYGDVPPVDGIRSWAECVQGELSLYFEPNLPSPRAYTEWLRQNLKGRQFIPYILDSDNQTKNLEGPTNVDALLINGNNGFAVVIEAKVLSDISCHITYDTMRNQISRNVDVMLEPNPNLCPALNTRDPEKTLFLLLTPRLFEDNRTSRLYGYKFNEYKNDPKSLQEDLSHRKHADWAAVSRRIGWLTWEDFREVNSDCCRWLA